MKFLEEPGTSIVAIDYRELVDYANACLQIDVHFASWHDFLPILEIARAFARMPTGKAAEMYLAIMDAGEYVPGRMLLEIAREHKISFDDAWYYMQTGEFKNRDK